MATRMFAVDLGAWSVKLAIASPGLRGATILGVVEKQVPPGDEPSEQRIKQTLAQLIEEQRLREEAGYIGCNKSFEGRRPKSEYKITAAGRKALHRYLEHIEAVIKATRRT